MTWENVIKRGRSFRQRKKIAEHNAPIQRRIDDLERQYKSAKSQLIATSTSKMTTYLGYDKQLKELMELQAIVSDLIERIEKERNKLKELPADARKRKD